MILIFPDSMVTTNKITAKSSPEQLPDDTATLKQMVLTLLENIDDLQGQLHYLKRQLFGKKSEKLDPNQRLLFEELYDDVKGRLDQQREDENQDDEDNSKKSSRRRKANSNHKGRQPLPEDLPRVVEVIEPSKEEQFCDNCNNDKDVIGEETTEVLEYQPASFYVKQYKRLKFGCNCCEGNISIGQLPPMVIDKGIPGESVISHIITCKYCDHRAPRITVYKMRDGPSQPEYRFWLQTTVSCAG